MARFKKRKWGWWANLIDRKHFKVKILCFNQNGACSKQYHNHRNELWLFLKGNGHLNRIPLESGQWALVKAQHMHQFIAQKKTYVLEIQFGDKCEESDIVRV